MFLMMMKNNKDHYHSPRSPQSSAAVEIYTHAPKLGNSPLNLQNLRICKNCTNLINSMKKSFFLQRLTKHTPASRMDGWSTFDDVFGVQQVYICVCVFFVLFEVRFETYGTASSWIYKSYSTNLLNFYTECIRTPLFNRC